LGDHQQLCLVLRTFPLNQQTSSHQYPLLSNDRYPCIDIVAMGRASSSQPLSCAEYIAVDLARPSQVAAAASLLAKKWYSDSVSSPFQSPLGHDIVINNAGVFTGIDSGAFSFALSLLRHVFSVTE
jgi:hypothetical protein